jgi:YD repeat-containing protein
MESSLALGADPRFGRSAPIVQSASTKTPSGLNFVGSTTRAVTLTDPADPFSLATLTETLNLNGRTYTDAYDGATKTFTHMTPAGRQGITLIEATGRVVQKQTTGLFPLSYTYDARGRLASITQGTDVEARMVNFNYDPSGYLQTVTDPLNRTVNYEYDVAGRVTRQVLPDDRKILYGYDAKGNLISLTPPGRPAHVFAYTPVDQTAEYIPPAGTGTGSTLYTYNLDKQLTHISRPDGQVLDFGYDSAGQLSTLKIPTGVLSYVYDSATGKLTTITAPDGGTLDYSYSGALLTQTAWAGTITGSVGRTYDNDFRVTSLTVNGADPVAFSYDADSLLTTAGALTLNHNAQNGLLTGTALDSITDTLTYSGFGEVTDYSAMLNATEIFGTQYSYDKLGRITQKVERTRRPQGRGASRHIVTNTFDYGYDLAGRLTEVKQNGVVTASYTYDGNGNRLSGPGLLTPPTYCYCS